MPHFGIPKRCSTVLKWGRFQNGTQHIDNVSDYDSEHHRISKLVHHRLDLGPISLLGAQQHTTVESAAALKRQDKIEGKFKAHVQSDNG